MAEQKTVWYTAAERLPVPGKMVKMRWEQDGIYWFGLVEDELKDLKPEHYDKLEWCYYPGIDKILNDNP